MYGDIKIVKCNIMMKKEGMVGDSENKVGIASVALLDDI